MRTKKELDTPLFETSDFGLAAYLLAGGRALEGMRLVDGHRFAFLFDQDGKLDSESRDYWDRKTKIEPRSLQEAQKSLKSRIYGERPNT